MFGNRDFILNWDAEEASSWSLNNNKKMVYVQYRVFMTWEEHGMDADECKKDCRKY